MAPGTVATRITVVPAPLFHPEIVPFKSAKINSAGLPSGSTKEEGLLLLTWPVGPCGPAAVVGIVTVSPILLTVVWFVTAYSVDVLVPWFDTQKGLVARWETPQGFLREESVSAASPEMSETRFV